MTLRLRRLRYQSQRRSKWLIFLWRTESRAIWNFAHTDLHLPEDVIVESVHLSDSLMTLSYNISQRMEGIAE